MGRSRRPPSQHIEPVTPSQAALLAWLRGPPRRSQVLLAAACRVSQQLISAYANRRLRPDPGSEAARLLEIATAGRVTPSGWLTPDELAERDTRNMHAAAFACAIASGTPVGIVTTAGVPAENSGASPRRRRRRGDAASQQRTARTSRHASRRAQ